MTTPTLTVALAGNPNSGKSTVFNALTGASQRTGNWPGVTVERKSGFFSVKNQCVEVIDLPGIYSMHLQAASLDEKIASDFLRQQKADVIINVIDASHLERHLYLTMELLECNVPVVLALNMMDMVDKKGLKICVKTLSEKTGCPVVLLEAHREKGVVALKKVLQQMGDPSSGATRHLLPQGEKEPAKGEMLGASHHLFPQGVLLNKSRLLADGARIRRSRGRELSTGMCSERPGMRSRGCESRPDSTASELRIRESRVSKRFIQERPLRERVRGALPDILDEDPDILKAEARYRDIDTLIHTCVTKTSHNHISLTERLDNIVLNRFFAIPFFLCVMYAMFFFAINIGGAFQDFFDITSETFFVSGFENLLTQWHTPTWLIGILAHGLGKGINTTLTFIPVIGAMFLFLAFLEDSGYMARAAFVMDRVMRTLGLPGKSFVPMITGFGCNVPAVLAARTLENKRDRMLTVMMTPFMSCGARLAIYAVFTAAFFPKHASSIVFFLYLTGILMAMLTGLLLRKTVLSGNPAPLMMELPPYHVPEMRGLFLHAWQRLKNFIFRAGKLILPLCILLGMLHPFLSSVGQWFTPVFAPMGIHQDNWPATVGLVTGVLAKEVVIGTLNALYSQTAHLATTTHVFHFWDQMWAAIISVPHHFSELTQAFANPVLAKAPVTNLSQSVYGEMYQRFGSTASAIAYLLFVLLYFPCVSTVAVMARESGRRWAIFSVLWTTVVAYSVATGFYQIATFDQHPMTSLKWLSGMALVFITIIFGMRRYAAGGVYDLARHQKLYDPG